MVHRILALREQAPAWRKAGASRMVAGAVLIGLFS